MARLELELDGSRLNAGAEQAEKGLDGVKASADRAEKSLDRLGAQGAQDMRQLGTAAQQAARQQTALASSTQKLSTRFQGARGQIQNVSFQLGDFATQVGAGTAASVALGQQLPQLLGGFGALGAVLGAVVAIGVPLAAALLRSGEGAKSAADALSDLERSTDRATEALERSKLTVSEIAEEYGVFADSIREVLDAQAAVAVEETITKAGSAVDSLDAGPLENILRTMSQIENATGPAAVAVAGLRQELQQVPQPIRDAADAYRRLQEASTVEEQRDRAQELLLVLKDIDGQGFGNLRSGVSDLIDSLREAAEVASSIRLPGSVLNAAGRGGAGAGGPLINSVDAGLLRNGIQIDPNAGERPSSAPRVGGGASAINEAEKAAQAYERLRSSLDPLFAAQQRYNSAVEILDKNLAEGNITLETHAEVLALARQRYEEAAQGSDKMRKFAEELAELQDTEGLIVKGGQALQQSLSDFLFNPFETGVRGMVHQFSSALQRMASDAIAAQITQAIFGGLGMPGFGSGGGGLQLFDSGGYIPSGQVGMVAEKRPEVVNGQAVDMPAIVRGPANVQGGAATARAGSAAPVVNQKTVVALSTSDLASEVVRDPQFRTEVIQIGLVQGWG